MLEFQNYCCKPLCNKGPEVGRHRHIRAPEGGLQVGQEWGWGWTVVYTGLAGMLSSSSLHHFQSPGGLARGSSALRTLKE